jgi:CubicO group peptidase (beta-lactamase class C family)
LSGALRAAGRWPGSATAGYSVRAAGGWKVRVEGPSSVSFAWASLTKVLTSLSVWIAAEEGTVALDDPAGPEGSTLADLLSHASGLAPDDDRVVAPPRRRRIYSNRGIELAADHLSTRAGMAFGDYLQQGVLDPLGMDATSLTGSPAHGASGPVGDLLKLGRELLEPTLVSKDSLSRATSVATPGLAGVLPGFGRLDPNDWGLGVEIRSEKRPHWTGSLNSPETFGHFGRAGGFLWVDPVRGMCLAALGSAPFGPWAVEAWPELSDAVITEAASPR